MGSTAMLGLSVVALADIFRLFAELSLLAAINGSYASDADVPVAAYSTYITWGRIAVGSIVVGLLALSLWCYVVSRSDLRKASPEPSLKEARPLVYAGMFLLIGGATAMALGMNMVRGGHILATQRDESRVLTTGLNRMEDGLVVDLLGSLVFVGGTLLLLLVVWHVNRQLLTMSVSDGRLSSAQTPP